MITTLEKIKQQIIDNPIVLYMKGSPKFPSCNFSAQVSHILSICTKKFFYIDVLVNPDIRVELPKFSNWPTFPQLWIKGNLIGGCDIITEMYQYGSLQNLIKSINNNLKK